MLSFGIETLRAFSIAFWSARLAAGSPPPSFAATMIARESFEKSLPRFASAAPFLCLMLDHLLCPDMRLLPHHLQEPLVHPSVVGQLGVERGDEVAPVPEEHRLAVQLREHLHLGPDVVDLRRADEDPAERLLLAGEVEVGLEARHLPAVGVSAHADVHPAQEAVPPEQDHARARAEDRALEAPERLLQPVDANEAADRRRLPAGDDEAVEVLELPGLAHLDDVRSEPAEHGGVLAEVALKGENADPHPSPSQ